MSRLRMLIEKLKQLPGHLIALARPALARPNLVQPTAAQRQLALAVGIAAVATVAVIAGMTAIAESNRISGADAAPANALPGVVTAKPAPATGAKDPAAHRADRGPGGVTAKPRPPAIGKGASKVTKTAGKKKPAPKWVTPMPGAPLSSCFGMRWGQMHQGLDFAGKARTPIRAVGAGTVLGAGWLYSGYGMSVVINHGNGYLSHYAHASKLLVHPGQRVKPGQPIALEGATGDSQGPHLHFEIHHGLWNQIDPARWLRAHAVKIGC